MIFYIDVSVFVVTFCDVVWTLERNVNVDSV